MKFIENIVDGFSDDTSKDEGNLVETILVISGFAIVGIALVSWIGTAIAGQAANISSCIAQSNAGGVSEQCSEDQYDVAGAVSEKITAQGGKFDIPAPSSGGSSDSGGGSSPSTPVPTPTPTPPVNPNLAPAKAAANAASASLSSAQNLLAQAQAYYAQASQYSNFSVPSQVNQAQTAIVNAFGSAVNAASALRNAQESAEQTLNYAQQLGNASAITQAQNSLTQINSAQTQASVYLSQADYARGFSSGGSVRNAGAWNAVMANLNTNGPQVLSSTTNAIGSANSIRTTLNNMS